MVAMALLIAAFVLFVLSAVGVPDSPRFRMQSAGLACWVLSILLSGTHL